MSSINKVILVGNLTADPELKHTDSGTAVTSMRMATNRSFKRGEEWEEEVQYHNIVTWAKQAENCKEYLRKGNQVSVEGRLQTREYDDAEGTRRYFTEVVAERVVFPQRNKGDEGQVRRSTAQATPQEDPGNTEPDWMK